MEIAYSVSEVHGVHLAVVGFSHWLYTVFWLCRQLQLSTIVGVRTALADDSIGHERDCTANQEYG